MKKIFILFIILSVFVSGVSIHFNLTHNELGLVITKYLWMGVIFTTLLSGIALSFYREVIKNDSSL